jgi:Zn-dependent peptidase ImmA (M78 family)
VTYHYQAKTDAEIEQTATAILARFPKRRLGLAVDIEGILEDLGMDLLPRRGVRPHAEGYLARDPRIIVVDEKIFTYPPRARFTLAEEVSHLVLEYELWKGGCLPAGADSHELSEQQHFFVEKDAKSLASALLMPAAIFAEIFNAKRRELEAAAAPQLNALRETLKHAGDAFQVSPKAAAVRALKLKLISRDALLHLFPDGIR